MKRIFGVLGIALLLSCGYARVFAQTDAAAPAAIPKASETKIEAPPTTYRLTYTLTEMDGGKRIGTQHFAVTVSTDAKNNWSLSRIKLGSLVPVATVSSKPEDSARTEFKNEFVGLNLDVRTRQFAAGVEVNSQFDQRSVSEEKSYVSNDPVIRQAMLENTALLTLGKPVMLGSLDVPGSTRHLDIEVVLEVVR
jgi:hypothetical protein